MSLYTEAKAAGLVTGSHESDLYLEATPEARELCERYGVRFSCFVDRVTGKPSFAVPFAFEPFWTARAEKRADAAERGEGATS